MFVKFAKDVKVAKKGNYSIHEKNKFEYVKFGLGLQ